MKQKILILGSNGFVGSAISRKADLNQFEILTPDKSECDLMNFQNLKTYFQINNPDLVINASGISGGINFNKNHQGYLFLSNQRMLLNLIEVLDTTNMMKFINITSSCIYSNDISVPFIEKDIGAGYLEPTNLGYATAKLSGFAATKILGSEKNRNWINIVGSNLYGPGDSIDLERAHVISALTVKFLNAIRNKENIVEIMGNGTAIRDWLYVDDFAVAVWKVVESDFKGDVNISSNSGLSIQDIVEIIIFHTKFMGEIKWLNNALNGAPVRILDNQKITKIGWKPEISIKDGINYTIEDIKARLSFLA